MPVEFDFTSPTDKPALIGLSSPALQAIVREALEELGYKVHESVNHDDFLQRFGQLQYQVAVVEELFGVEVAADNKALTTLQQMQMGLRRHATVVLVGPSFTTGNSLQAFQQSVHAVLNPQDIAELKRIVTQVVAETNLFLATFRDTQSRIAQGKV
jgi:8-oxo-dGTP pyrophosphatase MutT (NUDIX family)